MMLINQYLKQHGRESRNLLSKTTDHTVNGAGAALETFYYAFNNRDAKLLAALWIADENAQLNNPLGGIMRGIGPISSLYNSIFTGPAKVWVEFYDTALFFQEGAALFAGRERGEFSKDGITVPLAIRTSRLFLFDGGAWRQAHHHGSIDDPALLGQYQKAVRG